MKNEEEKKIGNKKTRRSKEKGMKPRIEREKKTTTTENNRI